MRMHMRVCPAGFATLAQTWGLFGGALGPPADSQLSSARRPGPPTNKPRDDTAGHHVASDTDRPADLSGGCTAAQLPSTPIPELTSSVADEIRRVPVSQSEHQRCVSGSLSLSDHRSDVTDKDESNRSDRSDSPELVMQWNEETNSAGPDGDGTSSSPSSVRTTNVPGGQAEVVLESGDIGSGDGGDRRSLGSAKVPTPSADDFGQHTHKRKRDATPEQRTLVAEMEQEDQVDFLLLVAVESGLRANQEVEHPRSTQLNAHTVNMYLHTQWDIYQKKPFA